MATEILEAVTIHLEFETGLDEKGIPIVKSKSFSNIKRMLPRTIFWQQLTRLQVCRCILYQK
ncbi:DUF1659 domain-containing protein [Peribacillus loiseleuriae]|uniref:DUF1659 domain-containing protein n=1 Tax=Peribacillus loiseleuriae TaxID=1679170 RepID=UPI0037F7EBC2